ncbi:hypothetical protein ADL26_00025 [Thermoactinomyces vulgaris]|nr:hypothetical protein ADL26_00025 [Thermoactinomyces vulgaris]
MPKKTGKYDQAFRERKLEEIKSLLAQEGYIVKSPEYVNNRTKLEMQCPHGHEWRATWDNIRQGKRCRQCYEMGIQKAAKTKKPTRKNKPREEHRAEMFAKFKKALEAEGYTIQTDHYINNQTKVPVICPRGHEWSTSWNQFDSGKRCKQCWIEDSRLTQEQVELELNKEGCKLLSQYEGMLKPFKYQCSCGRVSYIRLPDFRRGVRCQACGGNKRRVTLRMQRLKKLMGYTE